MIFPPMRHYELPIHNDNHENDNHEKDDPAAGSFTSYYVTERPGHPVFRRWDTLTGLNGTGICRLKGAPANHNARQTATSVPHTPLLTYQPGSLPAPLPTPLNQLPDSR